MRLRKLNIGNFRKIEQLSVEFPPGLSLLVGENNTGKTAIIDSLRLLLVPGNAYDALRVTLDDFRAGTENVPIEISCIFSDLSSEDEFRLKECLVTVGVGKFEAIIGIRVSFDSRSQRPSFLMWGGSITAQPLRANVHQYLVATYLRPLRDPSAGLSPGRGSQVSRLVRRLTDNEEQTEFEKIVQAANAQLQALRPIQQAKARIDKTMRGIAGEELSQETQLRFVDPEFHRIVSRIQPEIDGLPYSLNGLGYNNLVYAAASLSALESSAEYCFRSIIIEEPEAHLHPQLQVLLLRHLLQVANNPRGDAVQTIVSTHSPVLASQAPVDSVIHIRSAADRVTAVSVHVIDFESAMKRKLERFLDATRAELFFARRILLVEGVAEALLLPVLAQVSGGNLRESAVTVINAEGLNFNAYLPLFGPGRIEVPVAIISDGDDINGTGQISSAAAALVSGAQSSPNVSVSLCNITFEHELARHPVLLQFMLTALEVIHPRIAASLKGRLEELSDLEERASELHDVFVKSRISKGAFAQELAEILNQRADLTPDIVPYYIVQAFRHLGVVGNE